MKVIDYTADTQTMRFSTWMNFMKGVAVLEYEYSNEAADSFDEEAFKTYYDDGWHFRDAFLEDISNA